MGQPAAPRHPGRVEGWWLEVLGKGNKLRRVPVPPAVIARLGADLVTRGHPADPGANRVPGGVALLGHTADLEERVPWAGARAANPVDAAAGISTITLAKQIKGFLTACADALCLADPRGAARGGAGNSGHASLDTTARYVTTEAARRMAAMLAVWGAG